MNSGKVERSGDKLREVYETYLAGTDCSVYLSVIPDKNYFLAPLGGYPVMDYSLLVENLREKLDFAEYIDIFGELSLESFYRTDQHWRQETLSGVARTLADAMGAEISLDFTRILRAGRSQNPAGHAVLSDGRPAGRVHRDQLQYRPADGLPYVRHGKGLRERPL